MTYRNGEEQLEFDLEFTTGTARSGDTVDVATFRVDRAGGPTAEDYAFRQRLYEQIGAVTVAGGHAEAAMKRVLITSNNKWQQFADVDEGWTKLVQRLRQVTKRDHPLNPRLKLILDWSEHQKIKRLRDDVVHAYWWHFADTGVTRTRFRQDGTSSIVVGTLPELDQAAKLIFEYARRLDEIVVGDWPQARVITQIDSAFRPTTQRHSQS